MIILAFIFRFFIIDTQLTKIIFLEKHAEHSFLGPFLAKEIMDKHLTVKLESFKIHKLLSLDIRVFKYMFNRTVFI